LLAIAVAKINHIGFHGAAVFSGKAEPTICEL
jgi:hypothetical protein